MDNVIQNTLEKIKREHIAPESRWKFLFRKYSFWFLSVIFVIFGAISFSAAYYLLSVLDWDLYKFTRQNPMGYFLNIFPYFWAVLIGLFALVTFLDIRRTENGYRFSRLKISLIAIGGVLVLGATLVFLGLGRRFESMMGQNFPYYSNHMVVTKESQWMQPEKGLLAGKIVSNSNEEFSLEDFSGKNWEILLDEKTDVRPAVEITAGETIKVIGEKKNENTFSAREIRPWMGKGKMEGRGTQSARMMPKGGMMKNK